MLSLSRRSKLATQRSSTLATYFRFMIRPYEVNLTRERESLCFSYLSCFVANLYIAKHILFFHLVSAQQVFLSAPERASVCPGQTLSYSCITSMFVPSITWQFYCSEEDLRDQNLLTESVGNGITVNRMLTCVSNDFEGVIAEYRINFESSRSESLSNISITVLEANYFNLAFKTVVIDCESTRSYRYLDFTGMSYSNWLKNREKGHEIQSKN